jgi:uncharacterized membrane protein
MQHTVSRITNFLQQDPDPCAKLDDKGVVGFIKYKVEPIFEYTLYVIGMLVILAGALNSLATGYKDMKSKSKTQDEVFTHMRVRLSETISLGLTFILGAEVVKTFRVPNVYQLVKVTLLVLLRQLITYFLDQDVIRLRKEYPNL